MAEITLEPHTAGSDISGTSPKEQIVDLGIVGKSKPGLIITDDGHPPPKTDKPRPHKCLTCGRSFARLEHLKRHERSHTKEKPFECPECTRCFARRDLLLRHQQKLHMNTTAPARPRANRRESTSSNLAVGAKVRKNSSTSQTGSSSMRPRANTISHVDANATAFIAAATANVARSKRSGFGHSVHPSLSGLPNSAILEARGISAMPRNRPPTGLPKIETSGLPLDLEGGLRTAPVFQNFTPTFGSDSFFTPGNTINPAQLHFLDSPNPLAFDTPISPFHPNFNFMSTPGVEDDGSFDWIGGFDSSMNFSVENENAIAESSPSAMSTGSPAAYTDVGQDNFMIQSTTATTVGWQPSALSQAPMLADYSANTAAFHSDHHRDSLAASGLNIGFDEQHFLGLNPLGLHSPPLNTDVTTTAGLHVPFMTSADTPTTAASVGSSNRHSSVTSVCTEAITDSTRAALLATLSQPGGSFAQRKYSSPSSAAPNLGDRSRSIAGISLPSTHDLQRYIGAYIQYFHPHLPFLHIPTLSFSSPMYTNNLRTADGHHSHASGVEGGGGCLILAMAAIGALYEYDNTASKELFDQAKKMIQAYLEERRRADISTAMNGRNDNNEDPSQNTPLWLVQSMLLNVIYGHNCGDKMSADIASTHCAALVSLARAAGLQNGGQEEHQANPHESSEGGWPHQASGESAWYAWKVAEEKKRTLYAVFILSSMLVSAYNHSPALTNSEVHLGLPCEEEIWSAESYDSWLGLGGNNAAANAPVTFAESLGWLLSASHRQPQGQYGSLRLHHPLSSGVFDMNILPSSELAVSTFGCLVLIHALHNYIWETRQRHLGRQWTSAETEAMHSHIEPALVAWQAAWAGHPHHSIERPNPYGMGPLSADSIPLLDLAYVRLFVNLGRSKEAFWHRDWEQMAYEIARGAEIVQHADTNAPASGFNGMPNNDHYSQPQPPLQSLTPEAQNGQSTRRERHMRKAAFHAAHSLCTSDKLGVSFADFNSRELPIVSAMCAFDCAQVLAEWVTTVQERVGRYLGVLGRDPIDIEAVPGIMLLDQEDIRLFNKIEEFLSSLELKQAMENTNTTISAMNMKNSNRPKPQVTAYGSKILTVTLYMLECSAVWPVIRVMAHSLESQATFMEERAIKSTRPEE